MKTPCLFKCPKIILLFFVFNTLIVFSGGGLSVLEMWFFQLSVGVKASTVESKHISFFPLMCLSFWFQFVFISLHVPFILHSFPFMFLSFAFHVPFMFFSFGIHVLSCSVAIYQTCRSSKGDMFKPVRWVSAQTLAFSSYFVIVFVIVLLSLWRLVQVATFRVHEHVHV